MYDRTLPFFSVSAYAANENSLYASDYYYSFVFLFFSLLLCGVQLKNMARSTVGGGRPRKGNPKNNRGVGVAEGGRVGAGVGVGVGVGGGSGGGGGGGGEAQGPKPKPKKRRYKPGARALREIRR